MSDIFLKLLNMSITASWIALAVIVLRLILKKAPKWINCILWAMVGLRLLLPVSVKSILSLVPSTETVPKDIIYAKEPQIYTGIEFVNSTINPVISTSFAPDPVNSANPLQIVVAVATAVWIIGVVLMLIYAIISYLNLHFKTRESIEIEKGVYICDRVSSPFVWGVIKPKIIIPSGMEAEDIKYVIPHEKTHIKRFDHLWKPLGYALLCVYWFNPVLWLSYYLLCRDIELACDEKVIKDLGDESKKLYSNALINCSSRQRFVTACPVAFGEVGVKGRIKSVLNYKKPAFWIIIVAVIISIAAALFFLTDPLDKKVEVENKENYFEGTILSVYDDSILVIVDEAYTHLISDKTFVSTVGIDYPIFTEDRRVGVRYNGDVQESYPTTVTGIISVEYIDEAVLSLVPEYASVYVYRDSPDPTVPTLRLSSVDNRFTFSYSALSSFIARGEYEIKGSTLILNCDDSDIEYRFNIVEDGYVFDEKNSSPIPKYKYGTGEDAVACVPDKAKFVFDRNDSPEEFLYTDYDIDNDGEKERISLSYGPTSGIFTFYLTVVDNGKQTYRDIYSFHSGNMSFEESESGTLRLKVEAVVDEVYLLDVVLENGHVCLYDNGVNIGYIYGNAAEEFAYKIDMLYETEGKGIAVSHPKYDSENVEPIKNVREAIIESHKYVTVQYDQVSVAYDKTEDIWRVSYFKSNTDGGDQTIYIPSDRSVITSVYGE